MTNEPSDSPRGGHGVAALVTYCVRLFSCRRYSELASYEMDRPLSLAERFSLRFHHLYCFLCRRFRRQVHLLDEKARRLNEHCDFEAQPESEQRLSDDARARIQRAMDATGK